jgi:hypothetical protein
MIEEETTGSTDREALLLAMERRDPERALGFYADDAELRVVNGDLPGSPEFGLRGRAEIGRYLRAVFDNDAPRRIEVEVCGEDRVVFAEDCEYPDGARVLVRTTLELVDGRILRHTDVVGRA